MSDKTGRNSVGLRALATALMQRANLASLFGARFEGKRDYYKVFGYEPQLQYQHMYQKYLRQGIASRVVDAPAQGLWNNPPTLVSNNAAWNDAWNRLVNKHSIWSAVLRLDKLAGIGRYACMYVAVEGITSTERDVTLRRPVYNNNVREVVHIQVYSQETAQIESYVDQPTSPQYMRPQYYLVNPYKERKGSMESTLGQMGPNTGIKIHWSQMLHVAENCMENDVFGSPRMERVFNDLDDLLKVTGGSAEAFWLTANRGMQVDIDKEMELTPEDAADLSDEIDEFQNDLRRVVRTRGVKINNLGADVSSPKDTYEVIISNISGGTGIPRRILIGTEAGQLASEQDRANWADRIEGRRVEFGTPSIIFPLISLLTRLGALPIVENLNISVVWPDAYKLSPLEYAQQSAQHARSAVNFARVVEIFEKMRQSRQAALQAPEVPEEGGQVGDQDNAEDVSGENPRTQAQQLEDVELYKKAVIQAANEERLADDPGSKTIDENEPDMKDVVFISIEEIRQFLGLGEPQPQLDDPGDIQTQ